MNTTKKNININNILYLLFNNKNQNDISITSTLLGSGSYSTVYKINVKKYNIIQTYVVKFTKILKNCNDSEYNYCLFKQDIENYIPIINDCIVFSSLISYFAISNLKLDVFYTNNTTNSYFDINNVLENYKKCTDIYKEKDLEYENNNIKFKCNNNFLNFIFNDTYEIDKIFKLLYNNNYALIINNYYEIKFISIKGNFHSILLFLIDSLIMLYYMKKNKLNHSDLKIDNFMFSYNNQN